MAPSKVRKVMGVVKDQTSIGLAKVASTRAPDLDVAIVKATSHDEIPPDEKYIQEILHLTSYSRGYVNACVSGIARRLGKTRNWIVALKAVGLIHRLLRDGDPSFEQEVAYSTRRGSRLLNLSDFRDDSHSNAWDYSAFVRTYALYLDERLDCAMTHSKSQNGRTRGPQMLTYNGYGMENGRGRGGGYYSGNGYDNRTSYNEEETQENGEEPKELRNMDTKMVFDRIHRWQRVLERFLACRPVGAAKIHRLVHFALYPLVKESFKLYGEVCEALAVILDRYFEMEYSECAKAFETYTKASKQIDELATFHGWCKSAGICRSSEYPDVQLISEKLLEKLEEFLKEMSSFGMQRSVSPEPRPTTPPIHEEPVEDMNSVKALPAPGDDEKKEEEPVKTKEEPVGDLLNLADTTPQQHENSLALALFAESDNTSWNDNNKSSSAWETPLAENGKPGWELALVESASNLKKQGNSMAGGFDNLLLEGLYDQAHSHQQYLSQSMQPGSASSVAILPKQQTAMLALPALEQQQGNQPGNDPFAASLTIPPPSYVQMSDLTTKQQYLDQEKMLWDQYQKQGMQGNLDMMKLYANSYGMAPGVQHYGASPYGMPQYGVPPYGVQHNGAAYYY